MKKLSSSFRMINITHIENYKIVRDDLYPFLGGGNKGRKMNCIGQAILNEDYNAIVTTGGIQSNHCRVVALFAAANKLESSLILHGDRYLFEQECGNAKLMRRSGANIIFVNHPNEISSAMDNAMLNYKNMGLKPYYLWGGGHTMEGGLAYIDAVAELKEYCNKNDWCPSHIFLASGTGSTQAGILAGLARYNLINTKVIGISVGRGRAYAENVVSQFYQKLLDNYNIPDYDPSIIVLDDYLMGGYGSFNDALAKLSYNSIRDFGFALDTCYSGKAFYGMLDYIQANDIDPVGVLFWHTGGFLNFLAT